MTVKDSPHSPVATVQSPATMGSFLPSRARRSLLWIVVAASAVASVQSVRRLPWEARPGSEYPGWVTRYGALAAPLAGEERAYLVSDDPDGTPKYKLFRAQFALPPIILIDRPSLDRVPFRQLLSTPLVVDASSEESFRASVDALRTGAAARRLELVVEPAPARLAVVRARPEADGR